MAEVVRVYRNKPVDGVIQVAVGAECSSEHPLRFSTDQRLLRAWKPVPIEIFWQDPDRMGVVLKEADIPASALGSLVVSRKGKDVVEPRFGEFVEFLPLDSKGLDLWAMHVLPSVSAIDAKRSRPLHKDIDWATLEPIGPQIGITEPYAFHNSLVASLPVFRDVEWRRGWFMTQPFVEFMRASGLSGFDARLIYDSELHKNGFDAQGDPLPQEP